MTGAISTSVSGVSVSGSPLPESASVLTPVALAFIADLQRQFNPRRRELLQNRQERQARLDAGEWPGFLRETRAIREDSSWRVGSIPPDLERRHVEIAGPTDRKMLINALNSGADVFMADFEDANAPTWANMIQGQHNVTAAIARTRAFATPEKNYTLHDKVATLMVRPRGWHLQGFSVLSDTEQFEGLVGFYAQSAECGGDVWFSGPA